MHDLTADEAARELGVTLATLYAYVSRGLLRSRGEPGTRRRRYLAEDVWLLRQRKEQRRDPVRTAEEALHQGLPAIESRLSVIREGRLYYRGRDVLTLAVSHTLEQVAALLWAGDLDAVLPGEVSPTPPREWKTLLRIGATLSPLEAFQLVLPLLAARDSGAYDTKPASVQRIGLKIVRVLAAAAVGGQPSVDETAEVLQRGWPGVTVEDRTLLRAALVLYADNGINPSSFTARCVASAGSTPYALVLAGLAALQGTKHGGACERAEALLEEAGDAAGARRVVEGRLRRGEAIPGFGHPLYPAGDPRGALLLQLVSERHGRARDVALATSLVHAVRDLTGQLPNVDFGVVTLCRALRLPPGAALALLGIGRTVGWIAHGLEQYQEGRLIRPRARYSGEPPQS
ncbi:citrate synthase family protein [Candidatus Binatia bacterium]|nr:citrate synthase family protein [Candidatus Binatia bacterium]